jgi:hydroxymethylpyrimidine pyrophosphatase-like HAD family hydrolase
MTGTNQLIQWNENLQFIISDVDETVADIYTPADPAMTKELTALLREGLPILFVTGQVLKNVQQRVINLIPQGLRSRILVGHCSGAEVWGFDASGNLQSTPYYSVYETAMTDQQKQQWRKIVQQIVTEFGFDVHPVMALDQFAATAGSHPLTIMLEDRGPQITFEIVNGYDLSPEQADQLNLSIPKMHGAIDLRVPIQQRANQLFQDAGLPITARLAGTFAIDTAVEGVSKTTAIQFVLDNDNLLSQLGLDRQTLQNPHNMEVWGDKFSVIRGGTDRHMSAALPKQVRSIDFRDEDPAEFPEGYNIVLWNGHHHLHHGLLDYLKSRQNRIV